MWGILNLRKARAAATTIVPAFINRTKQRHQSWMISLETPFVTGFVTFFITGIARERVQNPSEDLLGLVQVDVWGLLLNDTHEHIGEQISFQSSVAEPAFLFGCENARYFCQDLFAAIDILELERLTNRFCENGQCDETYFLELCSGNALRERILQDWSRRFETFI